jgi:hypothetical protein
LYVTGERTRTLCHPVAQSRTGGRDVVQATCLH